MNWRNLSTAVRAVRNSTSIPLFSTRTPPKVPDGGMSLPPLLMVHGVLASAATYRSIMKRPDFGTYRIG